MFALQVLDDHGQWRDDLVSDYTEDNLFATVADAEAAMTALIAPGSDVETLLDWRAVEVMATYLIAEVLNTGDWDIIEEFEHANTTSHISGSTGDPRLRFLQTNASPSLRRWQDYHGTVGQHVQALL
jgi:hypothetical protein